MLKASTLVEVMVAMVVVLTSFFAAMMLFGNVIRSGGNEREFEARLLLHEVAGAIRSGELRAEDITDTERFVLRGHVSVYEKAPDLKLLHLAAYDREGKLLVERKELWYHR